MSIGEDMWPVGGQKLRRSQMFGSDSRSTYAGDVVKGYPYSHPYPMIEKHTHINGLPTGVSDDIAERSPSSYVTSWHLYSEFDPFALAGGQS